MEWLGQKLKRQRLIRAYPDSRNHAPTPLPSRQPRGLQGASHCNVPPAAADRLKVIVHVWEPPQA